MNFTLAERSMIYYLGKDSCENEIMPQVVVQSRLNVEQSAFQDLAKKSAPSYWRLLDGIYKGLEELLKSTSRDVSCINTGCRSLFSTCLKKAPEYIAEQQYWSKLEDSGNDVDVSSEVYNDLENFHPSMEDGWESLRVIVRAHGVAMLGNVIKDCFVSLPIACQMLKLSLELMAYDEAQTILECMINRTKPVSRSGLILDLLAEDTRLVLSTMQFFATRTGRHGFFYEQIATLLGQNLLSIDFISSRGMIDCWNGVIRSITQADDHAKSAHHLLLTAVSISNKNGYLFTSSRVHNLRLGASFRMSNRTKSNSKGCGCQNVTVPNESGPGDGKKCSYLTISNLLALLTATSLVESSQYCAEESQRPSPSLTTLQDLGQQICQYIELSRCHVAKSERAYALHLDALRLPLLAATIATMASNRTTELAHQANPRPLTSLASLPFDNEASTSAGSFLCSVARSCDRVSSAAAFGFMSAMVQDLIHKARSNGPDKLVSELCGSIAVAGAFAFSEDTALPKHLDWALKVEESISFRDRGSANTNRDSTPARGPSRSRNGYRWEEGICEWISMTPASALPKPGKLPDGGANTIESRASYSAPEGEQTILSEKSPCALNKRPDILAKLSGDEGVTFLKCIEVRAKKCSDPPRTNCNTTCQSWPNSTLQKHVQKEAETTTEERPTSRPSQSKPVALDAQRIEIKRESVAYVNQDHGTDEAWKIGSSQRVLPAKAEIRSPGAENEDMEDELSFL